MVNDDAHPMCETLAMDMPAFADAKCYNARLLRMCYCIRASRLSKYGWMPVCPL